MPVFNGETTIGSTLRSLFKQTEYFQQLIIINDASSDNSEKIIRDIAGEADNARIITNPKNLGLAKSYNIGIREASGDLIVTMHQDIVLKKNALQKLMAPFENENIVAAGHADVHPPELWKKYNFWQKCYFSRFTRRKWIGINGQFDCFRKSALEKVGFFDEVHFRSAGEDGDMLHKLKKIGTVAGSDAKTIHIHKIDPNFSWRDIIRKQAQYSEAQGVLLIRGKALSLVSIVHTFFREILLLALLVPFVRIFSVALIILYSFAYTGRVYFEECGNTRIFVLPFFNILLLFVSLYYSLRGAINGKQRI